MSDFEDEGPGSLSSSSGLNDSYGTTSMPQAPGLEHKPFDTSFEPFSTQSLPPSAAAPQFTDAVGPSNPGSKPQPEGYGDDPYHPGSYNEDLPANFSRAPPPKNQEFTEQRGYDHDFEREEEERFQQGRGDEVADFDEGGISQGVAGSSPFQVPQDQMPQEEGIAERQGQLYDNQSGVSYDESERPIVGYNPFLEELQKKEEQESRIQNEKEEGFAADSEEEEDMDDSRRMIPEDSQEAFPVEQEQKRGLEEEQQQQQPTDATADQQSSVFDQAPLGHGPAVHPEQDVEPSTGYQRLEEDHDDQRVVNEEDEEEDSADLEMDPVTEHVEDNLQEDLLQQKEADVFAPPPPAFENQEDTKPEVQAPSQIEDMEGVEESKAPLIEQQPTEDFKPQDDVQEKEDLQEKLIEEKEKDEGDSYSQNIEDQMEAEQVDIQESVPQNVEFDHDRFQDQGIENEPALTSANVNAPSQKEVEYTEEEKDDFEMESKQEVNEDKLKDEEAKLEKESESYDNKGFEDNVDMEEKREVEQEAGGYETKEEEVEAREIDEVQSGPAENEGIDYENKEIVEPGVDDSKFDEETEKDKYGEEEKEDKINEAESIPPPASNEDYSFTGVKETDQVERDYEQEENTNPSRLPDFESRGEFGDKTMSSSDKFGQFEDEERRSFADTLESGRESPVVPQPLPSPPEPREGDLMSPFDPLAPQPVEDGFSAAPTSTESAPPFACQSAAAGNLDLGQSGDPFSSSSVPAQDTGLLQNGMDLDNTACLVATQESRNVTENGDFLTAGEVEGETRFDVDGTAITSTADGSDVIQQAGSTNPFIDAEEYEDEEEEEEEEEEEDDEESSQHMDTGVAAAGSSYATTETEPTTSAEEKSGVDEEPSDDLSRGQGEEGVATDNALMSMSMEGSFYDDGGDLIGGDDGRNGEIAHQDPITEESSSYEGFTPKQDSFLSDQDHFNQLQNDLMQQSQTAPPTVPEEEVPVSSCSQSEIVQEQAFASQEQQQQESAPSGIQEDFSGMEQEQNQYVNEGFEDNKENDFGSLVDTEPSQPASGVSLLQDLDSSVDYAPAPSQQSNVDSFLGEAVDASGVLVCEPPPQQETSATDIQENQLAQDIDNAFGNGGQDSEPAPAKPEEPSSSVDDLITPVQATETKAAAAAEPSATPAAAAAPAVATTTATSKTSTPSKMSATSKSTATTKKSTTTAKAGAKTTTTTTTTKTTREIKSATARPASAKKTETTTTTSKSATSPRKPSERPASAKTTPKTATSPTKPTSAPASNKPLPSYAQPITPRKPREPKFDEKEKQAKKTPITTPRPTSSTRPASATTTTTPRPTSSSTPRAPRPATATSASKSTTRTSTTTATKTSTTPRTSSAPRPKTAPSTLTNGTAKSDSTPTTKKYGIDSRNEGYKPGGGNVKITSEKKEIKSKGAASAGAGAKSPTKPTTPRTPGSGSKPGEVKSKIGSLNNATHTPGGGTVRITTKKPDYSNVSSKIGSKDKIDHKPGGGNVRIESRKIKIDTVKSRVGSLDNASHKPAGGDKKIETKKLEWKVESKIGSLENAKHVAGGGDKKVETRKVEWNASSKIGSLDNAKHTPGGGDKKIDSRKVEWNAKSRIGSLDNATHTPGGGDKKIEVQKTEWKAQSKIGSLDNANHTPGGGDKKILSEKLEWKADARIGSLDNSRHLPGGGNVQIESHKLDFKEKASPKVGTLEKLRLNSGGSDEVELQQTEAVATNGASEN